CKRDELWGGPSGGRPTSTGADLLQAHHLKDRVGAVVIFIVAALGWWWSGGFPAEAQMFPRAILGLLGLLAVIMFGKTFAGATTADDQPFIGNARNLAITIEIGRASCRASR